MSSLRKDRSPWIRVALVVAVLLVVPALALLLFPPPHAAIPLANKVIVEPAEPTSRVTPIVAPIHRNVAPRPAETVALVASASDVAEPVTPGGISGLVVDEHGSPVTSYVVAVETFTAPGARTDLNGGVQKPIDDPSGKFILTGLAPGHYTLTASAEGRPPTRSDGVDVESGQTTRGVRITLMRGILLTGVVTDRDTKAPLNGATIALDGMTHTGANAIEATTSAADGTFTIDGVPAATFSVRFSHVGYRDRILSFDARGSSEVRGNVDLAQIADGGATLELSNAGLMLQQGVDQVLVGFVVHDGPGDKAGVRVNDRVVSIDGKSVDGLTMDDCVQKLRGPEGSTVLVTVERDRKNIDFVITRALVSR